MQHNSGTQLQCERPDLAQSIVQLCVELRTIIIYTKREAII